MIYIKKITAFLLATIMLLSICACGKETEEDAIESGELVVVSDTTDINLGIYSIDTLNPLETSSKSVQNIMNIIYEPLFTVDAQGGSVPVLAESYALSADGFSVTVNLKKDVKWHDGTVFTADDVVYTLSKLCSSKGLYKKTADKIRSFTAISKSQVQINLEEPQPDFTPCLTFPIISSRTSYCTDDSFVPMGTGSYRFASRSGTELILEPNTGWYGDSVSQKRICVKILKDGNAAAEAFNVNELDAITSDELDLSVSTPKNNSHTKTIVSDNMVFLGFNTAVLPVNIRRAAIIAIDKKKILENEAYGHGMPADSSINPSSWAYQEYKTGLNEEHIDTLIMQEGYRIEDGIFYKDGVALSGGILVNSDNAVRVNIAEAIRTALNAAGFSTYVEAVSYNEYIERINSDNFDMFVGETEVSANTNPCEMITGSDNYFNFDTTELSAKMKLLFGVTDRTEYKNAVTQCMHTFYVNPPYMPLYFKTENVIYGSYVSGIEQPVLFDAYKNIEKWYFYDKNGKEGDSDGNKK
ncbi:MAG: ABC transporter substrate-binding protein [Clostridiales bacterium]|nr:ABC transporter substrate-binding protein [Clostridiales bacterium]